MTTKSYDYDRAVYLLIAECLEISGYANSHFRMNLLKTGKIESVKMLKPGTQIPRVLVVRESFEQYMKANPRRAALTPEEMIADLESQGYVVTKA